MKKYFSSYWIRSAVFTFLQRFSLTLFGLINFMILIRVLTKPQMGVWALFLIITTIFESTKAGLLKNAHIKFVSADLDNFDKTHIASSSLSINTLVSIVFIFFIAAFHDSFSSFFNSGKDLSDMLLWFIPGLIFMVFFSHLEAIQQSHFDFKGIFAGHLTRQVTFFLLISWQFFFKAPFSMIHLAVFQSISIFAGTMVLYAYSRRYMLHIFNPSKLWIKRLTGYGGYIFGSGLVSNLSSNTDQMMMGAFMSPSSVATYNVSTRISGFVDIPSNAAAEILFPKMVQANEVEGSSKVKYFLEKMISVLLAIVVPSAFFVILFPKFVIGIIAGKDYYEAALILQLYMLTSIIGIFQNQAANTLNSIGKPFLCFKLNLASFIAKLIITYSFLMAFDFYGAAIGTLVTYILTSFLWYLTMKKLVGISIVEIFKMVIKVYQDVFTKAINFLKKSPSSV